MQESPFYLVWNPRRSPPHFKHADFAQADTEAKRLARSNPGVPIPDDVAAIHGITTEIAIEKGIAPTDAHGDFMRLVAQADLLCGHNVSFDIRLMRILAARVTGEKWDNLKPTFCTMRRSTNIVKAMKPNWRTPTDYKWPNLTECVRHFFDEDHGNAHSAAADCAAARRVYFHLQGMQVAA